MNDAVKEKVPWVDWLGTRTAGGPECPRFQICPKISGEIPYNPIFWGMGCFDHQSYDFSEGVCTFLGNIHVPQRYLTLCSTYW